MYYYLQGLTMGLAYVAPIGLQNLFVLNSALTNSRRRALVTALIVIFFDVTLAFACFFGIGAVMQRYEWLQLVILGCGSVIVMGIGIGLLRAKTTEIQRTDGALSIRKTISTACVVTWLNPQAIIDGTMMLGAFRVTLPAQQSLRFIFGVTSASCIWFLAVTLVISVFSNRFNAKVLRAINVLCGIIVIFYGCRLAFDFVTRLL